MKAGVVVPVYNTAPWLARCLDSLAAQTEGDFVAILVDDGSTDGSSAILQERCAIDPKRFRCLHQGNAGQAAARNKGIDEALRLGVDYLLFVDSDDWVAPRFIEALVGAAEAEDADIASCELYRAYDHAGGLDLELATDSLWNSLGSGSLAQEPRWLLSRPGGIVDKAFKSGLFQTIRFPEGITFEDLATTPRLMRRAKRLVAVREPLYYYFQRPSSTVGSGDRRYLHAQEAIRIIKEDFGDTSASELEYVAVMRAAVGVAPRAARLPSWKEDLPGLVDFLDSNFPKWRKNPYLRSSPGLKNRLLIFLLRWRTFGLVKLLVDGKRNLGQALRLSIGRKAP